jgi:bifunctional non-homologous end joining protein LigD
MKFIEPMKARLVTAPPGGEWIYEIKLDGFRALALKTGSHVQLLSRNQKDFSKKFPDLADGLARLPAKDAIIDGEIVALTPSGSSSFQLLQAYDLGLKHPPIFFYAFDLLRLNGVDLRNNPLVVRKAFLEKLLKKVPEVIRYSASLKGKVGELLKHARRLGLEGLIGKRKDSPYEPGRRTGAWIKIKLRHEQELVIGGFTDPEGSRQRFGALLVGYYAKGALRFAGKVGTGFSDKLLDHLYERFKELTIPDCPFVNLPERKSSRYSQGFTAAGMRRYHWVKPSLICQVRFAEWTKDGKLRQPAFLGLREDKDAKKVIREPME